jgi:hypothetical protein
VGREKDTRRAKNKHLSLSLFPPIKGGKEVMTSFLSLFIPAKAGILRLSNLEKTGEASCLILRLETSAVHGWSGFPVKLGMTLEVFRE